MGCNDARTSRLTPLTFMVKLLKKYNLNLSSIDECIGFQCMEITLGTMRDCGEPYTPDGIKGGLAIIWGITFKYYNDKQFSITWGEDSKVGDPFYISVVSSKYFGTIDSYIETKILSESPLFKFVDSKLVSYNVYDYETNYPGDEVTKRKNAMGN